MWAESIFEIVTEYVHCIQYPLFKSQTTHYRVDCAINEPTNATSHSCMLWRIHQQKQQGRTALQKQANTSPVAQVLVCREKYSHTCMYVTQTRTHVFTLTHMPTHMYALRDSPTIYCTSYVIVTLRVNAHTKDDAMFYLMVHSNMNEMLVTTK